MSDIQEYRCIPECNTKDNLGLETIIQWIYRNTEKTDWNNNGLRKLNSPFTSRTNQTEDRIKGFEDKEENLDEMRKNKECLKVEDRVIQDMWDPKKRQDLWIVSIEEVEEL